jgi:hypothetical protein
MEHAQMGEEEQNKMIDKIFEMLLNDNTKYIINRAKLDGLERLTTELNLLLRVIHTGNIASSTAIYIRKQYLELLDMQCLLVKVLTVKHILKRETVTIKEIFEYIKGLNIPVLETVKELTITAIVNNYLIKQVE